MTRDDRTGARTKGPSNTVLLILGVVVVLSAVFAVVATRVHAGQHPSSDLRASGIPSAISTPLANLMALSPVPSKPADDFVLTDQHGATLPFSSFKGRAVVLEFMDPHCTDICPIVSQEFVDAYHDLGTAASRVAFVAVNVNKYNTTVADMAAYSGAHQLSAIPTWHFFTGSVPALAAVWRAYGIDVYAPSPTADVVHTSLVFFIDPAGHERFLASPTDDRTARGVAYLPANQISSWGRGIAIIARGLSR